MSKLKNVEIEERALDVASTILELIEQEALKGCENGICKNDSKCCNIDKLKKLADVYSTLKPYF